MKKIEGMARTRSEAINKIDSLWNHILFHLIKVIISDISPEKWCVEIKTALLKCNESCNIKTSKARLDWDDIEEIFAPSNLEAHIRNRLGDPDMDMYLSKNVKTSSDYAHLTKSVLSYLQPEMMTFVYYLAIHPEEQFRWLTPDWVRSIHPAPIKPVMNKGPKKK